MKNALSIVLVGLVAALAAASGAFIDRAETLRRVASGAGFRHGFHEAGALDRLSALAWEHGGWVAADLVGASATATPVFLVLLSAAVVATRLPGVWRRAVFRIWVAAAMSVFCWGFWNGWKASLAAIREPRLLAPVELIEMAERLEGRVHFSPAALYFAPLFAASRIEAGSTPAKSAGLQASLADWRAEDRKNPFSGIVFAGGDVRPGPFLDMIRSMPGWGLAAADNHGLLFVREQAAPEVAALDPAKRKFESNENQALFLAQSAMVQQAIGQPEKARRLLDEALEISETSHVLVHSARFAASERRWADVLESAESVLKKNPWSTRARYLQALALFESGAISKAAEQVGALADSHPDDPAVLGLQVRIAARNNDPATEIAALEKLLALGSRAGQPVGDLHALLGQAWARRGFPSQALANYQAALDADPPPDVREQIEQSIKVIRERVR